MTPDRRQFMGIAAALPLAAQAGATEAPASRRFAIWPGSPPPASPATPIVDEVVKRSATGGPDDIAWPHVGTPALVASFAARPTGAAILLIPGGGYARVATGRNPSAIARWFASRGVSAFELLYRLPHDHWPAGAEAPLHDAQRAMRLIRARALSWSIDPAKVAAMGFSAGGHLAAWLSEAGNATTYPAQDAADAQPAAPLVAGLLFPVISMMPPIAHAQSRRELLGPAPDEAAARRHSAELNVPAAMPPTLLGHCADDPVVPMGNSLAMFAALQARRIPSELYIVEKGGHGPPLVDASGRAHFWLERFALFAQVHGLPIRLADV